VNRLLAFLILLTVQASGETPFRLSLASEPASLSTLEQKSSSGAYLIDQIHAPLLRWQDGKIAPGLGQCHAKNPQVLQCEINSKARWSNGEPILARQLRDTYLAFLDTTHPGIRADLLLGIQGASDLLNGKAAPSSFGFRLQQKKPRAFSLQLVQPLDEFEFNLSNPLLAPLWNPQDRHPDPLQLITSGPYVVNQWQSGKKIGLVANKYYVSQNPGDRPPLEMSVITEDTVAMALYQKAELDFLRHLPTLYIPQWKDSPQFHKVPQFRFDFFAFGPALDALPDLRRALSESLAYSELQQMFWAEPRPGCPGFAEKLYAPPICSHTDTADAKKLLANIPAEKRPNLRFVYSKAGGDDHERTAQWLQDQWHKVLGLEVSLQALENKTFLHEIATNTPPVFRRGISPDRPTCLAVLENFSLSGGENAFHVPEPELEKKITALKKTQSAQQRQKLCHDALALLISHDHIVATGPMYFSILVQAEWTGWRLNNLNQLDLSDLRRTAISH